MVLTQELRVATRGDGEVIDITDDVGAEVAKSAVQDGIVTLFVPGSTAGLTTIEYESGAVHDLQEMFERIASARLAYRHNLRWGDGNGHAHVRAALLGASLTVPFSRKRLLLGTWQQIVMVDFDNRPRERRVVVQIMGDGPAPREGGAA
ncbi:MAG: YjbQ family protein [Anaerolineae bacterium]|nr:YjbQ family protein [Anaerolineae bacterium]